MVHKGSLTDGQLDDDDPFRPEDLEDKTIPRDAEPSRAGRGGDVTGAQLRAAAKQRQHSWSNAVAYATWRAEELRAGPFDMATATNGFEPNPFRWKNV